MTTITKQVRFKSNELEAVAKCNYLQVLADNLSTEALGILAQKSKKPGIEGKLKQFQNLI